ncbi:MAG: hypothetical protein NVS9B4_00790 [Candidatus Acidiferrum sp.]
MAISNITTGQQTVTATGPVTAVAGLDISGVTGMCAVHVRIQSLSAAAGIPKVAITLEDSVNGFTASVPVAMLKPQQGTIDTKTEVHRIWQKYDMASCRFGTVGAVLRANVVSLSGTTPSCTIDSWLET